MNWGLGTDSGLEQIMEINGVRDVRMVSRALQQRWPISADDKAKIIKRLVEVIEDPKSSERAVISAAKGLLAAEEQNQKDDHFKPEPVGENRYLQIAANLGIPLNRLTNGSSGRPADSGE